MEETQETPRKLSPSEMMAFIVDSKLKRESAKKAKENLANRNEFMRGVVRGTDQLQATYQGAVGMANSLVDNDMEAARRFSNYQDEMRQSTENPATVDKFFSTDPKSGAGASVGNMATWAAGTAGSLIPSVAESALSGVAGAAAGSMLVPGPDPTDVATVPIGAIAGVFSKTAVKNAIAEAAKQYIKTGVKREAAEQMATQAVRNTIAKKTGATVAAQQMTALNEGGGMYMEGRQKGHDNPVSALALGQISGASEVAFGAFPSGLRMAFAKAGVAEVAKKSGPKAAAGYAWDVINNGGQEGIQEAFQEYLGSVNEKINDPKAKILTKENFMKWAESAAAGALGGGMFGAAEVAQSAYQNRGQQPPKPPGENSDTVSQNGNPPALPPTQTETQPTALPPESPVDQAPEELDPVTKRMGALDTHPSAHKWAEVVHGDRRRFKEAPDEEVRIQQWEKSRAAVTGVGTGEVQPQAVTDQSEAEAIAQDLERRRAAKSGVKLPPLPTPATGTPATPEVSPIGDSANVEPVDAIDEVTKVMDTPVVRAKSVTDDNNVRHELFKAQDGESGVIRSMDMDSGKVVSITKYPSVDAAQKEFGQYEKSDTVSQNTPVDSATVTPQEQVESPESQSTKFDSYADAAWKKAGKDGPVTENYKKNQKEFVSGAADYGIKQGRVVAFDKMDGSTELQLAAIAEELEQRGYESGPIQKSRSGGVDNIEFAVTKKADFSTNKKSDTVSQNDKPKIKGPKPVEQPEATVTTSKPPKNSPSPMDADGNPTKPTNDPDVFIDGAGQEFWGGKKPKDMTLDEYKAYRNKGFEGIDFAQSGKQILDYKNHPDGHFGGELAAIKKQYSQEKVSPIGDSTPQTEDTEIPVAKTPEDHASVPMFGVYKSSFKGKKKFFVKEFDNKGNGDSMFDSLEDANKQAELVKRRESDRKAYAENAKAEEETKRKEQQEYESSLGEFLSNDPKTRANQVKVLKSTRGYKGKVVTLRELVEQKVANGAIVNTDGNLESPDGTYLEANVATKTAINYAKHLIEAKSRDTVSQEPKRDQENKDAPKTKGGGDPNEVQAKDGQQKQTNAKAETNAEAKAQGQVGSKGDQATGEAPSSDSSYEWKKGSNGIEAKGLKGYIRLLPAKDQMAMDGPAQDAYWISAPSAKNSEPRPQVETQYRSLDEAKKQLIEANKKYGKKESSPSVAELLNKPSISEWEQGIADLLATVPAFKGASFEMSKDKNIVRVTRPDGKRTTINFNADTALDKLAEERDMAFVYGAYNFKTGSKDDSHIFLRSNGDPETLNHEVVHWLEDEGIITKEEVDKYGGREGLAEAYGVWAAKESRKSDNLFDKIYDFLESIFNVNVKFFKELTDRVDATKPDATSATEGEMSIDDFADIFANPEKAPEPPSKKRGSKKPTEGQSKVAKTRPAKKERSKGVEEGLKEAKEGADLILKGLKGIAFGDQLNANVPINADIARGLGMLANGLIKAGKHKFTEFLDETVKMIGVSATKYLGPYLEAGWNKKAETDSRLDKAENVTTYLSEKENETERDDSRDEQSKLDAEDNVDAPRTDDTGDVEAEPTKRSKKPGNGRKPRSGSSGNKRRNTKGGRNDETTGDGPDSDSGGNRDGISSPAGLLSNHRIGERPSWLTGGAVTKLNRNIEAIETMQEIEREGRRATPEEQSIIAQYTGWGHLKQFFIRDSDLLAVKAISGNEWNKAAFEKLDSRMEQQIRERGKRRGSSEDQIEGKLQREKANNKHRVRLALSMTPNEYSEARKSTRYSHYTDPAIARAMWKFVASALPEAGKIRVLEPSEGSGMFWGTMPDSMFKRAEMHGIDMDTSSSRVAKHLYPSVRHLNIPYQESPYPEAFFDVAITNVPFNQNPVVDPTEDLEGLSLHNYYFAKTARRVREGGVVAFITTHFTMDAGNASQRSVISHQGLKFLGAVRLNQDAFGNVANTKVTTDIIVMQKVAPGSLDETTNNGFSVGQEARNVPYDGNPESGASVTYHEYFAKRKGMVAGTITANGEMRGSGPELTVESNMTPEETAAFIDTALANIQVDKDAFVAGEQHRKDMTAAIEGSSTLVPEHLQDLEIGKLAIDGNQLVLRMSEDTMSVVKSDFSPTEQARAKKWFAVRDAYQELRILQRRDDNPVDQIEIARDRLNEVYDDFVGELKSKKGKKDYDGYKPINTPYNKSMFSSDFMSAAVLSLENTKLEPTGELDKNGNEKKVLRVEKASIFKERNEWPPSHRPKPETIREALAQSLFSKGGVDIAFIAESLDRPQAEVVKELEEYAFRLPNDGGWEIKEFYLSGNIAQKLQVAEQAAEQDAAFTRNVNALKSVLPVPKSFEQLAVQINSPFVPEDVVQGFVVQALNLSNFDLRKNDQELGGGWITAYDKKDKKNQTSQDLEQYSVRDPGGGRIRRTGFDLIGDMLSGKPTIILETDQNGRTSVNAQLTNLAKTKRADLLRAFDAYVREDQQRMDYIASSFNNKLSGYVKQELPDWAVSLDGMSQNWKDLVRPYQKQAIAKIALGGNTLLAHRVGYGKTLSGVAGIMEQRRLGVARKPVIVVPNHLTGQWAKSFSDYYPSALVMAPISNDFEKSKRQATMNRIMTGNWDAVIIPESSFKKLPMSPGYVQSFFRSQIAQAVAVIEQARAEEDRDPRSIAELENIKERLEATLAKYLAESQKDPGPFFDEMGIDSLGVDEAHHYKNLPFYTQNTRIAGINPTGSQQAFDMLMKTEFINELTGSRNVTFLTGTPIANSMTEAWVMMRYLMPEAMKDAGVFAFDDWKTTFGAVVDKTRVNTIGTGFRTESRFQEFVNIEVLSKMFQQVADVQMKSNDVEVPPLHGGKPKTIVVPASDAMKSFMIGLAKRSENMPDDPSEDNMLNVMGVGAGAAIDFRLLDVAAIPSETTKLKVCADEVSRIFNLTTPFNGTQIIWSDRGVPKAAKKLTPEMKELGAWMLDQVQSRPVTVEQIKEKWKELRTTKGATDELRRFLSMAMQDMQFTQGTAEDEDVFKVETKDEPTVYMREITDVDPNITEQAAPPWNVYQETKELLIARGIPSDQIVFIHDYKTAAQKVDLFKKMNAGDVRVLIGNTPRLGTGANIQQRLVAAHHLDVPWRPADVEQRDGRIIRSGNLVMTIGANKGLAEIHGVDLDGVIINRYVTEGSIDARYWDTNEMKAQMLQDFWSESPGVSMEELGATTLGMAEVKAAAVANPLLREKIELETELAKLEEQYRGALQSNTQTKSRLRDARDAVSDAQVRLDQAKDHAAWFKEGQSTLPKNETLSVEIDGKVLFRRDDVANAVEEKLAEIGSKLEIQSLKENASDWSIDHKANSSSSVTIGSVFGKPLKVTVEGGFRNRATNEFRPANSIQEERIKTGSKPEQWERSYFDAYFRVGDLPGVRTLGNNSQGFLARIRNQVEPAETYVQDQENALADSERTLKDVEKLAASLVTPDNTKLLEVQERLENVSNEIGDESNDQVEYWVASEELAKTLGERGLQNHLGRVDGSEDIIGYVNHPQLGKLSVFSRSADTRPPNHGMVWVEGENETVGYVMRDDKGVMGLPILKRRVVIGRMNHPEHGELNVFDRQSGEVPKRGKVWVESREGDKVFGYQDKDKNIVMGQAINDVSIADSWPEGLKTSTNLYKEQLKKKQKSLDDQLRNLPPPDTLYQTDDVNPSIRTQALDIAIAAEDAGVDTFDKLVSYSVKTVGERRTREIGEYLRLAANAVGFKGVRQVGDILGSPNVTKEQAATFAKAAFPMLSDEQIESGVAIVDRLGLLDKIGFSPAGSPVPAQDQNQKQNGNVKGWTSFITATRALIGATSKADISTFIHEIAHPMRRFLLNRDIPQSKRAGITDSELLELEEVLGVEDGEWKVENEEKFAKMWEQYWFEGKAQKNSELESLFEKIARWMKTVYQSFQQITGVQLPQEVRELFDKLVRNGDGENRDTVSRNRNSDTVSQNQLPETTSIKNENVNARRSDRGVGALADVATQTQQEWLDAADQLLQDDPMLGDRLVKEINNKARNLSNVEVAVMQIYYRQMNNRLEKVSDRLFTAKDAKDAAASAQALINVDIVMNALVEIEEATKAAGREWGRAGVARQIELEKDFSRAAVMRKARIANGGNALSEKQLEDMNALARKVADLEGKLAKAVQEKLDLERKKNVEAQIEDTKTKVRSVPESIRSKAVSKLNKLAARFGLSSKTDSLFATEDEQTADEATAVVQAYVDMGVFSLGEFLANIRKDLGSDIPVSMQASLSTAWKDMYDNGDIPAPRIDRNDVRGLSRLAKQIERSLVEAGITKMEDVVRGVRESLQEIIPDITERETMDALSGYGQYSPPSEDANDKIIADINGRLLELAKLDDMENGIAPARTGVGRQEKSDEHRELIRKVNQAKRDGKYRVTDPDTQLKSAVGSALTALANRIYDLNKAINVTKQPIVSATKEDLAGQDARVVALRKERDELAAIYKTMFPKPDATMEQRIAATDRALARVIADLEKQLQTGNFTTSKKSEPISTKELDAKRARIDELRAQREAIVGVKKQTDEQKSKAYKANLLKQIADYQDRSLHSFFGPKPKKEARTISKEEVALKLELQKVKDEFFRLAGLYRLENMSPRERAWDYVKETAHLSRALMTSLDFSAVFRQGGTIAFGHPKMAKETSMEMYKAMLSEDATFELAEKIRSDDMYQFAMTAGLSITEEEGKITKQEEAYMGRWAKLGIGAPGTKLAAFSKAMLFPVSASARGYMTFLNGLRFKLFKQMVANLGKGGQVTADEAKVIAMYINAATGRSELGPMMKWAEQANMLFFAPRFVASRFQYLGMPLWLLGSKKVSGRVKKAIAMEYIRHSAGVMSFLALTVALGSLLAGDDEEEPTVSLDPRSSDFLKIKLGETRIDPMSGLSQVIVLMGRVASGQRVGADGTVVDLRGENVPYGGLGMAGTVGNFVRTKFAPIPGAAFDTATGENVVGQPVTPYSSLVNLFVPLSLREIKDTAESRGIPQGALITLFSLHGMGASTYGPESNYRKATPEQREKQFGKDLKKMTADSKEPAYKEFLSEDQKSQVSERREDRKQSLVFAASANPIRKAYRNEEAYKAAVAERDASLESFKKSGLTLDESRKLLIKHWESTYGSAKEMRKGVRVYKEALSDRLKQLRKVFAE